MAGLDDPDDRLRSAFAAVERERFAGPGPWSVFGGSSYSITATDDPAHLYEDVLIGLAPERHINNGQPSLHALCLSLIRPQPGESVLHVGAGTGYYTAIIAELVGPAGRVIAHEIEGDLAARAARNLADWPQVDVRPWSGTDGPFDDIDAIYVNAGVTHPTAAWLDALRLNGRLMCPLTTADSSGAMLLVTRTDASCYTARFTGRVGFIPCMGARTELESLSLTTAFAQGDQQLHAVRSLRRTLVADESAWFVGDGWWLSVSDCPE